MDVDAVLASELSVAELAEVTEPEKSTEQEGTDVTVVVTVTTQEAGHVRGHAAANGENAMTASTHVATGGDIVDGQSSY